MVNLQRKGVFGFLLNVPVDRPQQDLSHQLNGKKNLNRTLFSLYPTFLFVPNINTIDKSVKRQTSSYKYSRPILFYH